MNTRRARVSAACIATMLLVAACGSSSDDSDADDGEASPTTEAPADPDDDDGSDGSDSDDSDSDDATDTTEAPETTEASGTSGSVGDFEPGDVEYRVINVLGEPVDIYVRTTGLVEAFTVEEGVAPGTVTDLVAPPADGRFVVTKAGAGDPTCVSGCDHFIAELSAFEENGPIHTVVLYDDAGDPSAFDLWEQPDPAGPTSANAMAPADPSSGVVVVTAIATTDTDFGLRMAVDGTAGCLEPFNLENILIGGNQTPAFTYDGDSVDFVIHANEDRECVEEPVGGPFTVDGGSGERSHMILTGSPGDMDALIVPMIDTEGGTEDATGDDDGGTEDASGGDRSFAIEQMTAAVAANLPLDDAQSACTAELLVDAIGADVLVADGEFVDLDSLPTEFDSVAEQAIVQAITDCDIDPALLGG